MAQTPYTLTYADPPLENTLAIADFTAGVANGNAAPPALPQVAGRPAPQTGGFLARILQQAAATATGVGNSPRGSVVLDILHSSHDRDVVLDSAGNYLYTKYTVYADCLWSPASNSFLLRGLGPAAQAGQMAPDTDVALRDFLSQPRKTLTIQMGDDNIMTAPDPGARVQTDACMGPTPIDCEVRQLHGQRTWEVTYIIQVCLNEASMYVSGNVPPFLISNVWRKDESQDDCYYTTIVTSGHAVFRRDFMPANTVPDDYRAFLLPQPIPGWKRTVYTVATTEDGLSLDYVVEDKQLALSLLRAGITKVECIHTPSLTAPDVLAWATGRGGSTAQTIIGAVVQSDLAGQQGGRPTTLAGTLGEIALNAGVPIPQFRRWLSSNGTSIAQIINTVIAVRQLAVTVRVYGQPGVSRSTLETAAYDVLNARVVSLRPLLGFCLDLSEQQIATGNTIQVSATFIGGVGSTLQQLRSGQLIPNVRDLFPANDLVPNLLGALSPTLGQGQTVPGANTPPNEQGTRGIGVPIVMPQLPTPPHRPPTQPFVPRAPLSPPPTNPDSPV